MDKDFVEACRLSFLSGYFNGVASTREMMLESMTKQK